MDSPIATLNIAPSSKHVLKEAERYREAFLEDQVTLVEESGIEFDAEFLSKMVFSESMKKIGVSNGVTKSPFWMKDGKLKRNPDNPLTESISNDFLLFNICFEFKQIEHQIKEFAASFFSGYGIVGGGELTYRFCPTTDEGLHFDTFSQGERGLFKPAFRAFKLFLNVDSKPRVWRIGPTLSDFITVKKHALPAPCPDDANTFCFVVDKLGLLDTCETRQIEIPPGGMVIANGTNIAHQVVSGDRMVCLETLVTALKDRPVIRSEQEDYLAIMAAFEIPTTPDLPEIDALATRDGSFERAKKRLAQAD